MFKRYLTTCLTEDNWDRDTPISLSAYEPISQSVLSSLSSNLHRFKLSYNLINCLRYFQPIILTAIY